MVIELKDFEEAMSGIHEMFRVADQRVRKTYPNYYEYYEKASYLSRASDAHEVDRVYTQYLTGKLSAHDTRKRLSQIRDQIVDNHYGNEFEQEACRRLVKLTSDIRPQER